MHTNSIFDIFNVIMIQIGNAFLMLPFQHTELLFFKDRKAFLN